jgi:hypothetical protein
VIVYVVTTEADCEGHCAPDVVCASLDVAKAWALKDYAEGSYSDWEEREHEAAIRCERKAGYGPDYIWVHIHPLATEAPR